MKKALYVLGVILLTLPCLSYSDVPYGMAGCGLGSMIIPSYDNIPQVFAATTNSMLLNQGFAITYGTSNCLEPHQIAALEAQKEFITTNFKALSKDIAQGDGEVLKSFAYILGCNEVSYPYFASYMQKSYQELFSQPGALATLNTIHNKISKDSILSKECKNIY